MSYRIILASASAIRRSMLENAGVKFDVQTARIDETSLIASMQAEQVKPRDIADVLAEHKARKVGTKAHDAFVIGSDQVLDLDGTVLQKPETPADAAQQLRQMSGKRHVLYSAAVIYHQGEPVWRHIGVARMHIRALSDAYIDAYVARNWEYIQHCVGCYQLEGEGARLFSKVDGDYFTVLGLPLIELLGYLTLRGVIDG